MRHKDSLGLVSGDVVSIHGIRSPILYSSFGDLAATRTNRNQIRSSGKKILKFMLTQNKNSFEYILSHVGLIEMQNKIIKKKDLVAFYLFFFIIECYKPKRISFFSVCVVS